MGVATFANRILSGVIALSFFSLVKAITSSGAFFLFSALSLLSVWFTIYYVPETKGKSLEEIERDIHRKEGEAAPQRGAGNAGAGGMGAARSNSSGRVGGEPHVRAMELEMIYGDDDHDHGNGIDSDELHMRGSSST